MSHTRLLIGRHRKSVGKFAVFLSATLLLMVAVLAPHAAQAGPAGQMQSDMDNLMSLQGAEFETRWLSMMIEHHQQAVDMAQLAETRANRQEIKDVANNIIRDQTREIGDMTSWLMQWYNTTPMGGMMQGGMQGGMDMNMLRSLSGDEFDKAFLTMMHEHHMGAIAMAELVPTRATNQEVIALAQNIMVTQAAENKQFMDWAMSWYNLDLMAGMSAPMPVGMPRTGEPMPAYWLIVLFVSMAALTTASGLWLRRRA